MHDVYQVSPSTPSDRHSVSTIAGRMASVETDMKMKWLLISLISRRRYGVSLASYFSTSGSAAAPAYLTAAVTRGDVVDAVEATGHARGARDCGSRFPGIGIHHVAACRLQLHGKGGADHRSTRAVAVRGTARAGEIVPAPLAGRRRTGRGSPWTMRRASCSAHRTCGPSSSSRESISIPPMPPPSRPRRR